ncbi:MAG: hypothetical protein ABGZ17_20080, partial [Planctomycetaceae bacterium]
MILWATTRNRKRRDTTSRSGIVLFVVMVLVAMVAFAGFGFVSMMSTEYQSTRRHGDELQAAQAIASAESLVLKFAQLTETQRVQAGGRADNPTLFQGVPLQPEPRSASRMGSKPVDTSAQWHVSVVSPPHESAADQPLRFGLQNESARLHLATLLAWDREFPGSARQALTQLPNMTEALADAMLDWIDSDDIPREFGAESDAYLANGGRYRPRQALPQTLDELLLVQGVTREFLFGLDRNRNFEIDADEAFRRDMAGSDSNQLSRTESSPGGWSDHLTLHSAEWNRDPSGKARVDLNQDNLQHLSSSLSDVLPENLIQFIVA